MSLADEWDSIPAAQGAAPGARASVADDWDATPTTKPAAAKPAQAPEPVSWFERQLAKLPDTMAGDTNIRRKVGETLGASAPGRAVMGVIDMGSGAVQGLAHVTPGVDAAAVDKRIAETQGGYESAREAAAPQTLTGLVTGEKPKVGTDWWRIGGNVAAGVAAPGGKFVEGANFVNRLIQSAKVGGVVGLAQPVTDAANYWTEKAKQGLAGVVGGVVGQPLAEVGAKVAGSAANKLVDVARRFMPAAEDGTVAALRGASPELQAAVVKAQETGKVIDKGALGRQVEADSLPVKMSLTPGQAQQNPIAISTEMNMRGQNPAIVYKLRDQNQQLIENLNAIRHNVAPEATAADHVAAGQHLIEAVEAADAVKRANVTDLYAKLKDANGGQFPVDGKTFVASADQALSAEMKHPFLPDQVRTLMDGIRSGERPMTFENFENLRTILAAEGRKADRAGDGNTAAAVSTVRSALEALPMVGESAAVKPLADAARAAAKERFAQIEETRALKDVVNGTATADDFVRKHVINAKKQDLMNLSLTLKDDPVALQTIKAGVVNYLKKSAGIVSDNGNFSQAGYNKALEAMRPKLGVLFNQDEAHVLETVGNVARYTQMQPRGSYVNNSNTDVAAVARGAAAHAVDAVTQSPVGSIVNREVTSAIEKKANATRLADILNPGAGTSSTGAAEKLLTKTFPLTVGQRASIPIASLLSQYPSNRVDQRPGKRQ